mmetsp:Transcript_24922/g.44319  ORF Transcript_24922/g.44319 Transcript_24922/m.44319 type:complete len:305 (+) Transcript_24922:130-1044(+)
MSDYRQNRRQQWPREQDQWAIQPGALPAGAPGLANQQQQQPPPNYRVLAAPSNVRIPPPSVDYKTAINPYLQQGIMPPPQMPRVHPWATASSVSGGYDPYAQQMLAVYAQQPGSSTHWGHPPAPPRPVTQARPPIYRQGGKADSATGRYNELLPVRNEGKKFDAADAKSEGQLVGMIEKPLYRAISVNATAREAIILKSTVTNMLQKPPKRRLSCDLMEKERWYCPHLCGKFYRKSSTVSIRTHIETCTLRPRTQEPAKPNTESKQIPDTQIQPDFTSLPTTDAVASLPNSAIFDPAASMPTEN